MSACLHVCMSACLHVSMAVSSPLLPSSPPLSRLLLPFSDCLSCMPVLLVLAATRLPSSLDFCRVLALGCSFWVWAGTQLYDSCLSWCVSCRCLASQPFPSLLDSCALCEQDDLGSIITSLHPQHRFAMVLCYHMFMQGLGCMCLRPCWGSLRYMAHTCF